MGRGLQGKHSGGGLVIYLVWLLILAYQIKFYDTKFPWNMFTLKSYFYFCGSVGLN